MANGTVESQMADIFDEVSKRVKGVMETSIEQTAKETVVRLRSTSPKKSGSYAKGWKAGRRRGSDFIIHNATDYQLTHLLENGHVVRNKKGTYGRTRPIKHIEPAEEWASDELQNKIEKGLGDL